jgi:hypothetical protein
MVVMSDPNPDCKVCKGTGAVRGAIYGGLHEALACDCMVPVECLLFYKCSACEFNWHLTACASREAECSRCGHANLPYKNLELFRT